MLKPKQRAFLRKLANSLDPNSAERIHISAMVPQIPRQKI